MDSLYIAPSLLASDFANLAGEAKKMSKGGADLLHLDVMDGHFVPNLTFGPCVVQAIKKNTQVPLDVHLMISQPEKYIDAFIEAGSDWLSFHIEATKDAKTLIKRIKAANVKAAIAIKPKTPVEQIKDILGELDMILIMSVEPGFGGQKFMPEVLDKVRQLRKMPDCPKWIEIDGGINMDTVGQAVEAGVNILVAGSAIFAADDPVGRVGELREKGLSHSKG